MFARTLPFLIVALISSQTSQEAHLLTTRTKEGATQNYSIKSEMTIEGQKVVMTGKVLNKVGKVEKDRITMTQIMTIEKIEFGDEKIDVDEKVETETESSPTGDLLGLRGEDIEESDIRESSIATLIVPETPVKIGDKWDFEVKSKTKWHPVPLKISYEAVAIETIAGIKSMKIKFSGKENEGAKPLEASGEIWVSIEDGTLTKLVQTTKNAKVDEDLTGDTSETIERIAP